MASKHPVLRATRGRINRSTSAVIIAALGALSIAACGGSGVHAQTGPPTSIPASPATTATATSPAPTNAQRAVAAAVAQVKKYELLLNELAIHPRTSLDRLYTVATQPDVTDEIAFLNHFRSSHDRQRGLTKVVSVKVISVKLAGDSPSRSARPSIRLKACVDVSGVHAFGRDGKSIVPASRKPFYLAHLHLVNVRYQKRPTWLVARVKATEERSCGA